MQGLVERVGAGYCPELDVAAILEAHRAAIFRRLAHRRHGQASYLLARRRVKAREAAANRHGLPRFWRQRTSSPALEELLELAVL
jgi:hypothetical protein